MLYACYATCKLLQLVPSEITFCYRGPSVTSTSRFYAPSSYLATYESRNFGGGDTPKKGITQKLNISKFTYILHRGI